MKDPQSLRRPRLTKTCYSTEQLALVVILTSFNYILVSNYTKENKAENLKHLLSAYKIITPFRKVTSTQWVLVVQKAMIDMSWAVQKPYYTGKERRVSSWISTLEVVLWRWLLLFWQTQHMFEIQRKKPIYPYLCICISSAFMSYTKKDASQKALCTPDGT